MTNTQNPRVIDVRNPRTGKVDYSFTAPTPTEIADDVATLRDAQPEWHALGTQGRATVMRRWADEIDAHAESIGEAESLDTGRRRLSHDVPRLVADAIRGWCNDLPRLVESALLSGVSTTNPSVSYHTQLHPFPVVGAITPWNQPFLLGTLDAIPALLAGCTVLIKPSEITPRFIEPVLETVRAIPELAAVLRIVPGDGEVGQALIENVDAVCFTGSVATGRKVAVACAERFIPVFLELGGKDPAIVTKTADISSSVASVLKGAVWGSGQICFSTERVYVDDVIADKFIDELVHQAETVQFNYPDIDTGQFGPFIFPAQASIVDEHLREAIAEGAQILTGGLSENLGGGQYMRPAVVVGVNHDMRLMREETFGPVIPVMRYKSVDEAVRLANDTEFGLSAAVLAGTAEEALEIGSRIKAGAVSLQDTSLTINIQRDVEKTSFNKSGLGGSRMGPNSVLRFYRQQALIIRSGTPLDLNTFAGEQNSAGANAPVLGATSAMK